MANFHLNSIPYLDQLTYNVDSDIIVEIGSDQNEGSTSFFDNISKKYSIPFYSVDVQEESMNRLLDLKNTVWEIYESGSYWAENILPTLNKKIKVLYLDNYDWTNPGPEQDRVKLLYAERNVEWSNMGSQVEHLHQMIGCLPYMSDQSIIICDDTPLQEHSKTFIGKCGAVVPYLLIYGYKIVYDKNNGVILTRGI